MLVTFVPTDWFILVSFVFQALRGKIVQHDLEDKFLCFTKTTIHHTQISIIIIINIIKILFD